MLPHLQALQAEISRMVPMSNSECEVFLSRMRLQTVKKGDFFVYAGQRVDKVAFVNKGLLRYYFVKEGEEFTNEFFFEGEWMADYYSFLTHTPSDMYICALEDAELLTLSYDDMQWLYANLNMAEKFGRLIAEHIFIHSYQRNNSLLRDSPEERYLRLIAERPEVLARVPQYLVAGYLGIKPESLSRIRKRIWQNEKSS